MMTQCATAADEMGVNGESDDEERAPAKQMERKEASPSKSGGAGIDGEAALATKPSAPDWRAYLAQPLWEQADIIGLSPSKAPARVPILLTYYNMHHTGKQLLCLELKQGCLPISAANLGSVYMIKLQDEVTLRTTHTSLLTGCPKVCVAQTQPTSEV